MHLVEQELKKILRAKMVWIACALILLVQVIGILVENKEFRKECGGDITAYNIYANGYNDTLIEGVVSESTIDEYSADETSEDIEHEDWYGIEKCFEREYYKAILRNKALNIKGRTIVFWNNKGINTLVQALFGIISGISIALGLIFAAFCLIFKDKENEMDRVIYSSYIGRKEIIQAKALAILLFLLIWVSIYYWILVIVSVFSYGNVLALEAPIWSVACLSQTAYDMSTWSFLLVGYIMFIASGIFVSMCILLIVSVIKGAAGAFGACLAMLFLSMIMPKNGRVAMMISTWTPLYTYTHLLVDGVPSMLIIGGTVFGLCIEVVALLLSALLVYLLFKKVFWNGRIER